MEERIHPGAKRIDSGIGDHDFRDTNVRRIQQCLKDLQQQLRVSLLRLGGFDSVRRHVHE